VIPEPKMDTLLRLTYLDGEWALAGAEVDGRTCEVESYTAKPISFELAQEITAAVGLITAEVVRSNHLQWLDEQETRQIAERRRAMLQQDAELDKTRELRAKVSGETTP
jgi:hypothetical protein